MENTDKIQDKVITMLDALQQGVTTVGDKVVKYTPDVVDAGLWVIRIEGIHHLLIAFIGLCISSTLFVIFIKRTIDKAKKYAKYLEINYGHSEYNDVQKYRRCGDDAVISSVFACIPLAFLIPSFFTIVNPWNWIAIFEPKLYLAKQIIDSVIK